LITTFHLLKSTLSENPFQKEKIEQRIHVYDITFSGLYSTTAKTSHMNMRNIVLIVKMKPFYQTPVSMNQCNLCIAGFSKCK
jgi:hypothetical protein